MDVSALNTILTAVGIFLVSFLAVLGAIWWEIRALRADFAAERLRVAELTTVVEVLKSIVGSLPCKKGECPNVREE